MEQLGSVIECVLETLKMTKLRLALLQETFDALSLVRVYIKPVVKKLQTFFSYLYVTIQELVSPGKGFLLRCKRVHI
jgi:hypothetical protein